MDQWISIKPGSVNQNTRFCSNRMHNRIRTIVKLQVVITSQPTKTIGVARPSFASLHACLHPHPSAIRMVSPLPQELIDQILSFVTDDKTKTFRSCSRTCRAWAPVAQGRLFEHITIHSKKRADKFLGLLNASPHIARLPRLVEVREGRGRWPHEEKYAEGFLVKMASRLVNVGVLEIGETDVRGFSEQSAQTLCEGFLRVERLAFCMSALDASWVLSFLRTHSDIRHLLFSSGSIRASELPLSPLPPTVPHLHTLSVSYTLGIRLVLPFLCIQENNQLPPSITELHLNPLNEADEAAGCQLVLKLKDVLRTLVLSVSMLSSPSRGERCKGTRVPFSNDLN
jgi:hypothetical protein